MNWGLNIVMENELSNSCKECLEIKTYNETDYGWHNNATTIYGELSDGNYYSYVPDNESIEIYDTPITNKYIDTAYNYGTDDEKADDEWFDKFQQEHNITSKYTQKEIFNLIDKLDNRYFNKSVEESKKIEERYNIYTISEDGYNIYNSHKVDTVDTLEQAEDRVSELRAETGMGAYYEKVDEWWETNSKRLIDYVNQETPEAIADLIYDGNIDEYMNNTSKQIALDIYNQLGKEVTEKLLNNTIVEDKTVMESKSEDKQTIANYHKLLLQQLDKLQNKIANAPQYQDISGIESERDYIMDKLNQIELDNPELNTFNGKYKTENKVEDITNKQLKVVSYHLEDMGGNTMAVFGELSDGNYFSGNEEVLSIYDKDIWPLYYDDEDVTEFENNHLLKMIYLGEDVISKEDKELYYNIISQTSFFSDEDLEWLREDKLELDKLEESKTIVQLKQEIETAIDKVLEKKDFIYLPEDIRDYIVVDVKAEDDRIKIEIRAELDYDEIQQLITPLYKVIRKYDSEAYFDMEDVGIAVAYIDNKSKKITEAVEEDKDKSEEMGNKELTDIDNVIDTEKELTDGIKKEIYQYTKQQGLDIEKLRKQGIELESIADVIDKVVGNMVSKSAIEFMDKTNKDVTWDFSIENNDIQIILEYIENFKTEGELKDYE